MYYYHYKLLNYIYTYNIYIYTYSLKISKTNCRTQAKLILLSVKSRSIEEINEYIISQFSVQYSWTYLFFTFGDASSIYYLRENASSQVKRPKSTCFSTEKVTNNINGV